MVIQVFLRQLLLYETLASCRCIINLGTETVNLWAVGYVRHHPPTPNPADVYDQVRLLCQIGYHDIHELSWSHLKRATTFSKRTCSTIRLSCGTTRRERRSEQDWPPWHRQRTPSLTVSENLDGREGGGGRARALLAGAPLTCTMEVGHFR